MFQPGWAPAYFHYNLPNADFFSDGPLKQVAEFDEDDGVVNILVDEQEDEERDYIAELWELFFYFLFLKCWCCKWYQVSEEVECALCNIHL